MRLSWLSVVDAYPVVDPTHLPKCPVYSKLWPWHCRGTASAMHWGLANRCSGQAAQISAVSMMMLMLPPPLMPSSLQLYADACQEAEGPVPNPYLHRNASKLLELAAAVMAGTQGKVRLLCCSSCCL